MQQRPRSFSTAWVEFYGSPPAPEDQRLFALSDEVFHSEAGRISFADALEMRAKTLGDGHPEAERLRSFATFERIGEHRAESFSA